MTSETHPMKRIVIIGSGNLAEALARAVAASSLEAVQIWARNPERGPAVARIAGCGWSDDPAGLDRTADLYLIAVSDRAVADVASTLPIPDSAAVAHTAE